MTLKDKDKNFEIQTLLNQDLPNKKQV